MNEPEPPPSRTADPTLRKDGIAVIPGAFPIPLIEACRAAFAHGDGARPLDWVRAHCLQVGHQRFMFTADLQGPFMDPALYAAPQVLATMRELLGDDCILQSATVVVAYPGAAAGAVHRDHPPLFPELGGINPLLPPWAFNVMVPLSALTDGAGGTAAWPGSWRELEWLAGRTPQSLDALDGARVPDIGPGDAYVLDYRIYHRGLPNTSALPRLMLSLVYSRPWLRDQSNFHKQPRLRIAPAELNAVPKDLHHLFAHVRNLG